MKKKLSLMLVALLVISTMFGGSVLATTPEEPISYDPGDGSRWYYNQDFTKVVLEGVEYDNYVITIRNGVRSGFDPIYFFNRAAYHLADSNPLISDEDFFVGGGLESGFKNMLRQIAQMAPAWELLTINHVPWQDTEWADFYIEEILKSPYDEHRNPLGFTQQEIADFVADKKNQGLMPIVMFRGADPSDAVPLIEELVYAFPTQAAAPKESVINEYGGTKIIQTHDLKLMQRYGYFMEHMMGHPLGDKPVPGPTKDSIVMYVGKPEIQKGDTIITLDVVPYIRGSSTLIPLRGAMEALGANVHWERKDDSVRVTKGNDIILFKFGSLIAYVNGTPKQLPVHLERSGDRIMLPLRFLSENLGYQVNWYGDTKMIKIFQK